MKNIILLFVLISSLWAAKIDDFSKKNSYFRDYNSALVIAKKEHKKIMLVMVADFCPWCKKFERKTLEHEDIQKLVKQNFIPVIVDNYRDKNNYPKKFATSALPTVYFIDSNTQRSVIKSTLYIKKSEFLKIIKDAIK